MPARKKKEAVAVAAVVEPVAAPAKPKRKRAVKAKLIEAAVAPGIIEIMAQPEPYPEDEYPAEVDDFDDDFEPLEGCDCDMCNEARARRMAVAEPEPEPAPVEQGKAKRKPRARVGKAKQQWNSDVHIDSIKLLPPAPKTLAKAIAILKDPANIEKVRAATNISHIAMVGKWHVDIQFDRECHACCSSMVQQGNNLPNKHLRYKERYNPDLKPSGAYEYWNDKTNQWQRAYVELSKPQGNKRAFYNYRYMITWTNEKLKPEYHGAGGKEFTKHQKVALKAWYLWLAKDSQWARFFVGPKDAKTLVEYGCILDMSAPSFIVHLMAVAWRISGEYVEVVEEWYNLCRLGCDPHVAFGMAQNLKGWGDLKAWVIEPCYSLGHNLMSNPPINGLARLATGMLKVDDKSKLAPAFQSYSTSCNYVYNGDGYDAGWFAKLPATARRKEKRKSTSRWGGGDVTVDVVPADMWAKPWSAGWLWINQQIADVIAKKGWDKSCVASST